MLKKRLEELLQFAESTDLQELLWEKKGSRISLRRSAASDVHSKAAGAPASLSVSNEPPKPVEPMVIKSTMVGTFYRSDAPTRPPMVVEGTIVSSGQPVGAIEAMKIMKDVVAPMSCKIVKALVANGHPVEYGQPLFQVEAAAEEPANA